MYTYHGSVGSSWVPARDYCMAGGWMDGGESVISIFDHQVLVNIVAGKM